VKIRRALPSILAALALCSCLGNTGSSGPQPLGVQTYAGDGAVSVTWNAQPGVEYWVFHAQDPTLSTANWTNLLGAGVLVNTSSPSILCGLINNPAPTPLFPADYFTINGRTGSSPGGTGSALVDGTPRPAGGPYAGWVPGQSIPTTISALAYAGLTGCGYSGRPPSGMFLAVGPGGTIYNSTLAPTVAGPLSPSVGNPTMVWQRATMPAGFSTDLLGVAAYSYANLNTPGVAGTVMVAVGKGGTIVRSIDGQNWQQVSGVPTSANLNAVAVAGSTFVAVGDAGTVVTSTDSLNWNLSTTAPAASTNALNAIHCSGATCVAVGQNGTTLWTSDGGGTWTLYTYGSNNWNSVAYGNTNANADALVTDVNGAPYITITNESINTWVVTDANGNYAWTNAAGGWIGGGVIASSVVAIDYTTRFVALDAVGNAYASETGTNWQAVGASNVLDAVAMRSNGVGFVAIGKTGANASAF